MNQWIERIKLALPDATVGIIQGDKFQIDNDIVIGMLQTLSMREFSLDAFDDFGHVIIDECHTISSRVFSKALSKVNCKYMLGISATPTRTDGLMKVLKYYIGDTFFTIKSNQKNIIRVERYLLYSEDQNYNQEVMNFKGKPQIASMLNNVADCLKRTELIVSRVIELIKLDDKRQFLILSDRRQHLEDMFRLISKDQSISVGYYVGGLKKDILKNNESCKILLGTYPMASTGLDIPTLNGLVLATPRSDIIQSIGRIDRIIHIGIEPIIIDICDDFSIFTNQGRKRLSVFKKKKYMVEDLSYNLDKSIITMNKKYFFHNCLPNEDEENNDEETENIKVNNKDIINKNNDIDNMFKQFSFFHKH